MNRFISWVSLSKFAENKFIKRTYIYLIILPFLISVLNKYELRYIIDSIPFSWHVLFYCALSFTLGNILYFTFAPSIVKENNHFSDFVEAKKSWQHINRYIDEMKIPIDNYEEKYKNYISKKKIESIPSDHKEDFLNSCFKSKERKLYDFIYEYDHMRKVTIPPERFGHTSRSPDESYASYRRYKDDLQETDKENLSLSFWKLYEYGNRHNLIALKISFFLFLTGIILFGIVAINSVLIVIKWGGFKLIN